MGERRDKILMTLMIFVETGNIPHSTKYFNYTSKGAAITLVVEIFKRIHISGCDNNNADHNEVEEVVKDITSESVLESQNAANSLQQQLKAAISSITHIEKQSIVITTWLKKDFVVLANTKTRANNSNTLCTSYNKTSTAISTATEFFRLQV